MIDLDLNLPGFQKDLFGLQKEEAFKVFSTLQKLKRMTWQQVYKDKGLNWEAISRTGPNGRNLYTIRASKKIRAVVYREDNFMVFLSLHSDHDFRL